jgi:lysozyme
MRKVCQEAIELIMKCEGWRAEPYLDSGNIPTIGYGTTIYPNGKKVSMTDDKITKFDAEIYLRHHVDLISNTLDKYFKKINIEFNDNEFGALISFAYNLGCDPVIGKVRSMNNAIISKDKSKIASAFDLYVFVKKIKSVGLIGRRNSEKRLFIKEV